MELSIRVHRIEQVMMTRLFSSLLGPYSWILMYWTLGLETLSVQSCWLVEREQYYYYLLLALTF